MSKKYFLLALLPLLVSCNSSVVAPIAPPPALTDFKGMYTEHVKSQVTSIRGFVHDLGYRDEYNFMGSLKAAFSVPNIMSGEAKTEYTSQVQGHDVSLSLKNPHAAYEFILGTGTLDLDEINVISKAGDTFFRISGLKPTQLVDVEVQKVLKKYDKVWLSMTEKDITASMSGSSQSDIMSYQISRAISSLTLSDIESYLVEYPLWKEVQDNGVNGNLHSYSVELNRENIIAMVDAFTKKATGKPLDEESRKDIVKSLDSVIIKGVISFDPSQKDIASLSGSISASGSTGVVASFLLKETKDSLNITTQNEGQTTNLEFTRTANKNTVSFFVKDKEAELLSLSGTIDKLKDKVTSMNLILSAQGMTAELTHKNNPDGTFEGKVNFGVGNLSWKGGMDNAKLVSLNIAGAVMGKGMTLDLTKAADDMIEGPFVLKSGSEELAKAVVGLRIVADRFSLKADMSVPGSADPSQKMHAELDITSKDMKASGPIVTPSPTQSFKVISDELSSIVASDLDEGKFIEGDIRYQTGSDALPISNN